MSVRSLDSALQRHLRSTLCVDEVRHVDVAVVGAGVGGLAVALAATADEARDVRVVLLTKGEFGKSGSSPHAQGGIAAAVGSDDSASLHAEDTERVGRGLSDAGVVEILTHAGPDAIRQLIDWGAAFDRNASGELDLGREAGHSRHRILHAGGDATGREVVRAMTEVVLSRQGVDLLSDVFVWDLLLDRQGRVVGTLCLQGERRVAILAAETVLASGGVGQIYRYTTNPDAVTGDGIAMAARAGARLVDLEFVQFHPTTLAADRTRAGQVPLLTEALRGDGAWLVDEAGHRFMFDVDDAGELAPRDVVARTLFLRSLDGRSNYLDLRPVAASSEEFAAHFPTADRSCRDAGLDPMKDLIPVTPAAHYHMGGVWVDGSGRSSLSGLWACGEVTSTGAHGANRLASNSLLEALVFGLRVGETLAARPSRRLSDLADALAADAGFAASRLRVADAEERAQTLLDTLRAAAWKGLGIVRSREGLEGALDELERLQGVVPQSAPSQRLGELRNMLLVARLIARAALRREESRGGHYRQDYPQPASGWDRRQFVELPRDEAALVARPSALGRR